jgi:predicted transposase YdaD
MQRGIEKGREEGRAEGRTQGSRALLVRLLTARFGPLPGAVTERLACATTEQLERWAERVLDADSLDDVFTEN